MGWSTGTITDTTPHNDLSQKIKDLCGTSGLANWSFVENVPSGAGDGTSGSGSYSVDVFKCSGSGTDANAAATDWYVALGIPVTDGAVPSNILFAEDYLSIAGNPANVDRGKFRRWVAIPTGTGPTNAPVGAGYWSSDTYTRHSSISGNYVGTTATLSTTGFTYYLKMTNNSIFLTTVVGTTERQWGAHLLDSLTAVSDPCPLVGFNNGSGTGGHGFSRLPGMTTSGIASMWKTTATPWTDNVGGNLSTSNAPGATDFWQNNKIHVARMFIQNQSTSSPSTVGWARGLIKPDFLIFATGGTVNPGDTMVIDGNTWTVISAGGNVYGTSRVMVTRPI